MKKLLKLEKLEEDIEDTLLSGTGGLNRLVEIRPLFKLEEEINNLLVEEEEQWRKRSRALRLKSGDQNSNFFHQFANFRRNRKHIWEVKDDEGTVHFDQEALKAEATRFFRSFFDSKGLVSINDQVLSTNLFPRLVVEEDS